MIRNDMQFDGTSSFAMLGVLLILLSIIATAHISHLERLNYEERLRNDLLVKMDNKGEEYLDSIESKLEFLGVQCVFEGKIKDSGALFEELSSAYLEEKKEEYQRDGELVIHLIEYHVTLGEHIAEVEDTLPTDPGNLKNDGPGEDTISNRSFSYKIRGTLQVEVKETRSGTVVNKEREMDTVVDIPYPFIKDKITSFQTASQGSMGHVGRMVEYMLSTLAQYRTLMGYKDTEEILNGEDVELAVNLALILEMAYQFRYHDRGAVRALSENVTREQIELYGLLENYSKSGRVDPGDIISIYHGYAYDEQVLSREEATALNISAVISQALYSLVDQFIFNYLDYFGMIDIMDSVFRAYGKLTDIVGDVSDGVENVFSSLWSSDEDDEINAEHVALVKNWIEETFLSAGIMNTHVSKAIYHPYDTIEGDRVVGYPRLPDDFNFEFTLETSVKLTGDEHRWYQYECGHGDPHRGRKGHVCDRKIEVNGTSGGSVRCAAEEVLVGYDHSQYSIEVEVGSGQFFFDERDILDSDDQIWQDFFDEHYEKEGDNTVDSIRDAVKEFIERIVDTIMDHPEINSRLEELSKINIDVEDDRSLFLDIRDAVNEAVDVTFDHFRNNPEVIEDIVRDFLHDGDEQGDLEALKDLLRDNYQEFTGGDTFIDEAVYRTANELLSPESPHLEFQVVDKNISMREINTDADLSWDTDRSFPRSKVSRLIEDTQDYDDFIAVLEAEVDKAYLELKEREVGEENGLIVQALDHYQYYDGSDDSVRSAEIQGSNSQGIESIHPDPATQGVDTVHFNSSIGQGALRVMWISDIDGRLSQEPHFNLSARYMSPGTHNINLKWADEDGNTSEDFEELRINIPPEAMIDEVGPWYEKATITFTHSSYDPEGKLDYVEWDLGDGNISTDDEVEHIYKDPGLYNVTLTVYDDVGANDTDEMNILIDDRPKVVSSSPEVERPLKTDVEFKFDFSESVDPNSLIYSIEPYAEMEEMWFDNNSRVILKAEQYFQRSADYELTIEDVLDVDNGTASPLLEKYTIEFETVEFAELIGCYPTGDEIPVNRDVMLIFNESVDMVGDVDDLISGDHNWSAEFSKENSIITLSHEPFPSATLMELKLDLSVLRASFDQSEIISKRETTISFETTDNAQPLLISSTPSADATDVPVDEPLILEFDRPLNTSSFNYSVSPRLDGVGLEWRDNNRTVIIEHDGLAGDILYIVKVSGEDMKGTPFTATNHDISVSQPFVFRTEDIVRPSVMHFSPQRDTERFLSGAPITLVFNKPMNTSSLIFDITPIAGDSRVEWNDMGTTAYIYFNEYEAGEFYRFTLSEAKDTKNNSISDDIVIPFRISYNDDEIEGTLFEKKMWSIVGGGIDRFGGSFLDISEQFVKGTVSDMVMSSEFSELEYRVPLKTEQPFTYDNKGELKLRSVIDPSFIPLKEKAIVELKGGTHYTDITSISSRPYETHWIVNVPETKVGINVSRVGRHHLVQGENQEIWLNDSITIGFKVRITTASGWALEGVEYDRSDHIFDAVRNFLSNVWRHLKSAVGHVISGLQRILELFDSIVERLKEYGQEIIQILADLVQKIVVELLQPAARRMLDLLKDRLEELDTILSILGLDMLVDIEPEGTLTNIPMHGEKVIRFLNISLGGELYGTSYNINVNMLSDTVVAFGSISVRDMRFQWAVDPFFEGDIVDSTYDGWFQCMGSSVESSTELEIVVPGKSVSNETESVSMGDHTPIDDVRIPIGPVVVSDIDLGMELTYEDDNITDLLNDLLYTAFKDTVVLLRNTAMGLDYMVEFVRTLIRNILEGFISMGREFIKELVLYFECTLNEVELRLIFGIRDGESIAEFILWVAESIREMIEGVIKMRPTLPRSGPPMSVIKDTYLGVEVGRDSFNGFFYANVPALSAGLGKDMGRWNIEFGIDGPEASVVQGELRGG